MIVCTHMKVILLRDVAKVGKIHEVKDVSDGYALNSLIPRGLALPATKGRIAAHEQTVKQHKIQHEADAAAQHARIAKLHGNEFDVSVKADAKGHLYEKMTVHRIAEALSVPEQAVVLSEPIKTLGAYPIEIKLGSDKARITLVVKNRE